MADFASLPSIAMRRSSPGFPAEENTAGPVGDDSGETMDGGGRGGSTSMGF